jgi:lactate dehydrogenase-like 2-hydroxyacid dehydrogenase
VPAVLRRGIRIGYTPEVLNDAVADTTVMLVLMAMRRAGEAMSIVKDGKVSNFLCCLLT